MTVWYVYILSTAQQVYYTGITNHPERRLRQHSGHIKGGAKALRGKGPLQFECVFEVADKSTALKLEAWIKRHSRRDKEDIIQQTRQPPADMAAAQLATGLIRQMNSTLHSQ